MVDFTNRKTGHPHPWSAALHGFLLICLNCCLASTTIASETYSPYVGKSYPANVYWGDTHLHTNLSIDAYWGGNTTLGPADAYRFARGDLVQSTTDGKVKLRRPLDYNREPLSRSYAQNRSRWEPLYEVTQTKGDGESHPRLSPNDEFADYHIWNSWNGVALLEGRTWDAAAGYAAVWAEENTRESLFAAMKRKEVYGANLQRIQLIKGWLDESGVQHEKIYDIAPDYERGPMLTQERAYTSPIWYTPEQEPFKQ